MTNRKEKFVADSDACGNAKASLPVNELASSLYLSLDNKDAADIRAEYRREALGKGVRGKHFAHFQAIKLRHSVGG